MVTSFLHYDVIVATFRSRIPNAKFPPITALFNRSTYHKSTKALPTLFQSMNKLTLNEPTILTIGNTSKNVNNIPLLEDTQVQSINQPLPGWQGTNWLGPSFVLK